MVLVFGSAGYWRACPLPGQHCVLRHQRRRVCSSLWLRVIWPVFSKQPCDSGEDLPRLRLPVDSEGKNCRNMGVSTQKLQWLRSVEVFVLHCTCLIYCDFSNSRYLFKVCYSVIGFIWFQNVILPWCKIPEILHLAFSSGDICWFVFYFVPRFQPANQDLSHHGP